MELDTHLYVETVPTDVDLEICYRHLTREARRMQILTQRLAYGDGTPDNIQACMEKFTDFNCWLPILWSFDEEIGGIHWLHDMDREAESTWIGGYMMPALRGTVNRPIRQAIWPLIVDVIRSLGLVTVHCAILSWNAPALAWASEEHGYSYVGHYDDFILAGDTPAPCEVFTLRHQDLLLAEQSAEARRLTVPRGLLVS